MARQPYGRHSAGKVNPVKDLYLLIKEQTTPVGRAVGVAALSGGVALSVAIPAFAGGSGQVTQLEASMSLATDTAALPAGAGEAATATFGAPAIRTERAVVAEAAQDARAAAAPAAFGAPVDKPAAKPAAKPTNAQVSRSTTRTAVTAKKTSTTTTTKTATKTTTKAVNKPTTTTTRPRVSTSGGVIGNNYPGWYGTDPYRFTARQCTSFVAWRLNSANGVAFNVFFRGVKWGNASNWGYAARSVGYRVDNTPVRGAVAWQARGHVAWVARVNGDGTVVIEEYNWNYDQSYHTRTVPASKFQYIHIADLG